MKSLILLLVVLPFCLTIEVKLFKRYGNAIKKVEIPSCQVEPCALVKGTPFNISITVESRYPHEKEFNTVSDLQSAVDIGLYRDRYVYEVAQSQLYCKQEPNDCPLKFNKLYTINRQLFLSKDNEHSGAYNQNGKRYTSVRVIMMAHDNVGTVIGDSGFFLDVKSN